ncbi:MAG: NAD(P)H-hydrate dehydratase [Coriobacteriia bacterium]|nr:NAD(P)H-hydrate dehydratase [Coriobacteriia bacterium]
MERVLTSDQTKAIEQRVVAEGVASLDTLMRRAGEAIAAEVVAHVADGDIAVACGPGNNGGDGWVAAHLLLQAGRRVRVVAMRDPARLPEPAASAAKAALAAGVEVVVEPEGSLTEGAFTGAACVVDALLGTGSSLPLRDPFPLWCRSINRSGAYVVSADIPTGVETDTGATSDDAIRADLTVALLAFKRGHVIYPAADACGDVVLDTLAVPDALREVEGAPEVWDEGEYSSLLVAPPSDAHKNSRGRVLVVAGSGRYPGAAVLAARGAMRAGAGYVTLAVPEPIVGVAQCHLTAAPVIGLPSSRTKALSSGAGTVVIDLARDFDAVVLGPGLTLADGAVAAVRAIVARISGPLVIDADALNALVDAEEFITRRTDPTLLSPHPGELARLLDTTVSSVQSDRVSSSARLAGPGRAVVLKGAGTVVHGEGRWVINTSGTPALATAGTGDVLAGMLGALLARGMSPLEAGALGAYLHGLAGEAAAAELTPLGVTAEDLPGYVPVAMRRVMYRDAARGADANEDGARWQM